MMSEEPPYAIEMDGLTKRYGGAAVVDDLSLRIPSGCVFGFLGPNGAGKTTTIRMLMGLTRASEGGARVLGFDVEDRSAAMRARVGYVPELSRVYPWMRVEEVVGFCRSLYPTWNDGLTRELLALFRLEPWKKVGALSRGTLVKLALLLAVAHEPDLLVLDEPTSGLDPLIREEFLEGVLRGVCERPQTVFLSSHLLGDVERLADTVGILDQGRLLMQASTRELLASTRRVRVVVRSGDGLAAPEGTVWQERGGSEWVMTVRDFTEDTVRHLRGHPSIQDIEVSELSLEDIFKDLIKGRRAEA
jgi:ABC-2 type transport system ATP-binding protein